MNLTLPCHQPGFMNSRESHIHCQFKKSDFPSVIHSCSTSYFKITYAFCLAPLPLHLPPAKPQVLYFLSEVNIDERESILSTATLRLHQITFIKIMLSI